MSRCGPTATPIAAAIHEWMASHSVAEIMELATAFRIPCAPVGNGASHPAGRALPPRATPS